MQSGFLQKKCIQQDLADFLNLDKAYISRVVNGLYIPELRIRLKIASFFGVDSALIWRAENIDYIKQVQKKQDNTNFSKTPAGSKEPAYNQNKKERGQE